MLRVPVYKNQGFRKVTGHYYDCLLQRNPVVATWLGEHQYDGLLPEVGAEAVEKEINFLHEMRGHFDALGDRDLSLDERLDRQVVLFIIRRELFIQEDLRRWRLGRDLAMDIGDSIFLLYARDFAPLHQRIESIISRMKAAPIYLQSGRSLFQSVPHAWCEVFLDSATRLPEFLNSISKGIRGKIPDFLSRDFEKASKDLKKAIDQHIRWFKNAIIPQAAGDWALGLGAFQSLLSVRRLGMNTGELLELGQHHLHEAKVKMENIAEKLVQGGNIQEAAKMVRSKSPKNFEVALESYRDSIASSRAFVEIKGFATLPEAESLEVVETPSYMSHLIPFAAYMAPERNSRPQKGIYLVTRPDKKRDITRHCFSDISNTSIHEGYPGHHLQFSCQNLHPGKVRILSDSIEMIEGWAHYCEEEAKKIGFECTSENLFIQALDEAFRAARVLIDVNIHQKTWTFDQGLEFLISKADLDSEAALSEMRRYTQYPGYQLSYLGGKHLIYQLKDELKKTFGDDFRDRNFHNLILYEGSIPIYLAREFYPAMMRETLQKQLNAG